MTEPVEQRTIPERVASAETMLDIHAIRLKAHGEQIDELMKQNVRQDAKLTQICKETKDNTELSRGIKNGIKTIQWMFYCATAVLGLYLTLKQLGWM